MTINTPPQPKLPNPRARRTKAEPYPDHIPQLARRGRHAGKPKHVPADASCQVTPSQLVNANNARLSAIQQDMRLNTFLTVVFDKLKGPNGWQKGAPPEQEVPRLRKRILQSLADWCDPRGIPLAHVTCMENAQGPGPHMHMLTHLPEDAPPPAKRQEGEPRVPDATWHENLADLQRHLDRFTGWDRAALDAEQARMDASAGEEQSWLPAYVTPNHLPDTYGANCLDSAMNKLRYMVKAMSPDTIIQHDGQRTTAHQLAQHHGKGEPPVTLEKSASPYTRVMVSASVSLSSKARQGKGWTETTDLTWISRKIAFDKQKQEGIENQRLWFELKGETVAVAEPDWHTEYTPCTSDPDDELHAMIIRALGMDPQAS